MAVMRRPPLTASMVSCTPLNFAAEKNVSPIANRPTASVVTWMPSSISGTPKVSRACPVSLSMPISPRPMPSARLVSPRSVESPKVADTVTKASTISAK
ncbi:hypothetical protein D3C81_1895650 [compost metagenome]